jgi:cytoskeleton protein RodZ
VENSEETTTVQASPGALLREARERLGISPREMADRLKWMPANIAVIEEDRFDALRSDAFVRGYLRAYAKQVNLAEADVIRAYEALSPSAASVDTPPEEPRRAPVHSVAWLTIILGVVAAILLALAFWWWQQAPATPAKVPAVPATVNKPLAPETAESPVTEASPAMAADAVESADSDSVGATAEQAIEEVTEDIEAAVELEADAEFAEPDEAADVYAVPDQGAAADVDTALLEFSFSDDCWVEVRDSGGVLVHADLHADGDEFALRGTPPFTVLLGNASAVSLRFEGEPFPVRTRPGRSVANFEVGAP